MNDPRRVGLQAVEAVLANRRVLITGDTGFCGGWLALWLQQLGCAVTGIAQPPETTPNLFTMARIADGIAHETVDIRDAAALEIAVRAAAPDLIFHLAAQSLVRRSYREPLDTFATNIMGTANLLEASRKAGTRAVLVVTTDKVYRNDGSGHAYTEAHELGGHDPYSASKAAAELVTASFRASYPDGPAIATARGGNIIGGGDWAEDRLIPDFVRAISTGKRLTLRNPEATRPWQHVLALCSGYLTLGEALLTTPALAARAWNFGPDKADVVSVGRVVELFEAAWRPVGIDYQREKLHEAKALALDSSLAQRELGWRAGFGLEETVRATAEWYRDVLDRGIDARVACEAQIGAYRAAAIAKVRAA